MTIWETLLTNLATSGVVVAAAAWFLKRYLGNRIDYAFRERGKLLDSRLRVAEKYQERMIDFYTEVMPEIQETVYRSKNAVRTIVQTRDPEFIGTLIELWHRLSEYLYKYELFLPQDVFDKLHAYKNLVQRFTLTLGVSFLELTHEQHSSSSAVEKSFLSDGDVKPLQDHQEELESLYRDIRTEFRNAIADRGSLPE